MGECKPSTVLSFPDPPPSLPPAGLSFGKFFFPQVSSHAHSAPCLLLCHRPQWTSFGTCSTDQSPMAKQCPWACGHPFSATVDLRTEPPSLPFGDVTQLCPVANGYRGLLGHLEHMLGGPRKAHGFLTSQLLLPSIRAWASPPLVLWSNVFPVSADLAGVAQFPSWSGYASS